MAVFIEPFDPGRDFVTQAAFRANGKIWGRGYAFDKESVNVRTLRQLYEQHKLIYADNPRAIKLLSQAGGRGPATAERGKTVAAPIPASEEEQVARLMQRYGKTDLLAKAVAIPGIKRSMTKEEIARSLVRSGHGDT